MRHYAALAALSIFFSGSALAQVGGNLAALPALDVDLRITTSEAGLPVLSTDEIHLVTGDYYRINLISDGGEVWRVEVPDLLQNSHLRLVTIDEVEVHLQGLTFRAIELDEGGSAAFAFTPVKPGRYTLYVGRDPLQSGRPIGETGIDPDDRSATAVIVVE